MRLLGLVAVIYVVVIVPLSIRATPVRLPSFSVVARQRARRTVPSKEMRFVAVVVLLPSFLVPVVPQRLKQIATLKRPPPAVTALLIIRPQAMARVVSLAARVPLTARRLVVKRRQKLTSLKRHKLTARPSARLKQTEPKRQIVAPLAKTIQQKVSKVIAAPRHE